MRDAPSTLLMHRKSSEYGQRQESTRYIEDTVWAPFFPITFSGKSRGLFMIVYLQGEASAWGDYNCNTPQATVNLFLDEVANVLRPDFVIYSGKHPQYIYTW